MLKLKKIISIIIISLLIISCQTNKKPRWILEPPPEDLINIYFVGYGMDTVEEIRESMSFDSVLEQIQTRYNIVPEDSINEIFLGLIRQSFYGNINNDKASVIDRWSNDEELYILVRFKKDFIEPLINTFYNKEGDNSSFTDSEIIGDKYYDNGFMYKAFNEYMNAVDQMLKKEDSESFYPIIRCLEKGLRIIKPIKYDATETFDELIVNEAPYNRDNNIPNGRFYFDVNGIEGMDYSGFIYRISFLEGWELRPRETDVALVEGSLEFIPPVSKRTGVSTLESEINFDKAVKILKPWIKGSAASFYIKYFLDNVDLLIEQSKISFNYSVKQDLNIRPKIISFNNILTTEGIIRFLLEKDEYSESAAYFNGKGTIKNYIREINKDTEDMFSYLVLGEVISSTFEEYEGGLLYKLTGEFSIIDLKTSTIIVTQKVNSEFIGSEGEEDLAYLDLGLKIGEVIHFLKF